MQQQQRNPQQVPTLSHQKVNGSERAEAVRSAPIVLDQRLLQSVSGGVVDSGTRGPNNSW